MGVTIRTANLAYGAWSTRRDSGWRRLNRPLVPDGENVPLSFYPKALGPRHI
jgi:hypothetical protein